MSSFLPLLLAFGFINLPMLGWLAAAAAPILIHLWSRQKYREVSWAAMEYLLAAMRRRTRRMQFEQWLLLAVRTLLIVLLVLAVAEPFLEQVGLASVAVGRTHRVLVIDGSYSMAYQPNDRSRFEQAKALARRIVEESHQGDAFALILMASPPRIVVGTPAMEPGEVLAEIDAMKRLDTSIDLPTTVSEIEKVLENARRESPGINRHEVYFLTDLQREGWSPKLNTGAMTQFRRRIKSVAEKAALVVMDLGQSDAENIAVSGLRMLDPVATMAESVQFEATLQSFSTRPKSQQPVELFVDGRRVKETSVELPAGAEVNVSFTYRFETSADHVVEVRSPGDALEVDNHRWAAVPVRQAIRVLCVNGRPSGEPFHGATDYLVRALAPQRDDGQPSLVEVDVTTESALQERELSGYDVVFLADVAQLTAGETRVLDGYVRSGGNLVFFLGAQVVADRYNRELGGGRRGVKRLLPAVLEDVAAPGMYLIDPLEYRHPMLRAFRGNERAGLLTTPITQYVKLRVPDDTKAAVVAAVGPGDPLIVEEPIGHGRVVLVGTSADASWTPMPIGPGYVPLVQEILAFCLSSQQHRRSLLVGQALNMSVAAAASEVDATVERPDGAVRALPLECDGDYCHVEYSDTLLSGIYTARFASPVDRSASFAVNVDTAEGNLTQLSETELRDKVWPDIPLLVQTTWQNFEPPTTGSVAPRGSVPVDLLYVVLGLLFVESLLAWRFGYHA